MSLLVQEFRQQVSKCKDIRMKREAQVPVGYSTGFLVFDFKNGAVMHGKRDKEVFEYYSVGIRDGSMVMIIGRSGCGKTTWSLQAAGNIIRPYETSCIFHDDIEGGILEERKMFLTGMNSETFEKRYIGRDAGITAENFYERIKMIHDIKIENPEKFEYDTKIFDSKGERIYKFEPTVYLLDSLALLMPEKYVDEEEISGQMAATAAAKMNAAIFKRIIPMLKSANIILLIINHITEDVSINPMQKKKAQVSYLKMGEALPKQTTGQLVSNN